MVYAQAMTGSEVPAPGPRAQAALAAAKKELAGIASRHKVSLDELMAEFRKMAPHPDFARIHAQARQQTFAAYYGEIRKVIKAWREEHYVLAMWTEAADDINSVSKKVAVVFEK